MVDQLLPTIGALTARTGIAIDHSRPKPEMLLDRVLQLPLDIPQLGEDDDLVAVPGFFDRLKRLHQPLQLRRVVAQSLVWLNAVRMSTNELELVQQPEHAGGLLIELFFDLLFLAVRSYFGQVQIALQGMHAK
ncbi:hypothetical protein D3C72_1893650 [compost metagenome]